MRSPLLLTAAVGVSAMGCAVGAPDNIPDAEAGSTNATAIVVVERTSGPGDVASRDAVIARFVRVRQGAVDDAALRIAGVAQDLPALGTCSVPTAPAVQPRNVELLDVGPVSVDGAQGKTTVLLPRVMPDPAGVVSGVVYSSRAPEAFAPGNKLSLRANGGPDLLDGFSVSVKAPREVSDLKVLSQPLGLDITWDAADADARDTVYLDVLAPAPRVVVRCAATDVGRFVVPHTAIGAFEEGQIAVHRVRREAFRSKGIEPGEVRFDIARVVAFRR